MLEYLLELLEVLDAVALRPHGAVDVPQQINHAVPTEDVNFKLVDGAGEAVLVARRLALPGLLGLLSSSWHSSRIASRYITE